MFRDASEELERLQAELLAEEEPEISPEPPEEEYDEYEEEFDEYEEEFDEFEEEFDEYEEDEEPEVYRNYASGYRAYNTDSSDEDLEEYSEEVRSGGKGRGGCCLAVIACVLSLILGGLLMLAYIMGYIG